MFLGLWRGVPGGRDARSLGNPLCSVEPRGQEGKLTFPEQNVAFFSPICPVQGFLLAGRQQALGLGWCPVVFGLCGQAGSMTIGTVFLTCCMPGLACP